jgi:phosphate acetyltransferase
VKILKNKILHHFKKKKITSILDTLRKKAKSNPKTIIYPESYDDRILRAAAIVSKERSAKIILLGKPEEVLRKAKMLKINLREVSIIDPELSPNLTDYATTLYELRKHKGMTLDDAKATILKYEYFGTMMVYKGEADGLVSGAVGTTADTLRPALQIIKTKEGVKYASSFFIMVKEDKVFFFADCAFIQNPDVEELTAIAIQTADSAKKFGYEPKVAMLSFSTKGSAEGPILEKVKLATEAVKQQRPDLIIDGEMQLDAAIIPEVALKKCPNSPIKGDANVLIFPDLNSGNIGYKLVERFGHTKAIGPIVQGLKKPMNDLSRGCSVEDIVMTTHVTVVEAQEEKKEE